MNFPTSFGYIIIIIKNQNQVNRLKKKKKKKRRQQQQLEAAAMEKEGIDRGLKEEKKESWERLGVKTHLPECLNFVKEVGTKYGL